VRDDLLDFLLTTATEVTARVQIKDDQKTVADGGLWYEEALPTETILAGLVLASPVTNREREPKKLSVEQIFAAVEKLTAGPLQFGGKATVGRGLCRARLG
jgi:CRISPR-associated protein Cmr4